MNWGGVMLCLIFGGVLIGRMFLVYGLSYMSDKIGEEYDWNESEK